MANSSKKKLPLSPWEERKNDLDISEVNWDRPITEEDINYLLQLYPYIQIMNSEPEWGEDINTEFIKSRGSNWIIHDYGEALSTSPGKYLFGESEEDDADDKANRQGTIINQTYETAVFLVHLAIDKGWPAIDIISGTELFKWALWMAGQDNNYTVLGYDPSQEDLIKRDRINRLKSVLSKTTTKEPKP